MILDGDGANVRRRRYLRGVAAVLPLALAGCSGGGDGDDGTGVGDDNETINVVALDADPDDPDTRLRAAFDAETRFTVKPDEAGVLAPEQGKTQHLLLQLRVENVGAESVRVRPSVFQVANADGEGVYKRYDTDDPDQFPDRTLDPGDVATGWVAYEIPATEAKVLLAAVGDRFLGPVAVTFEETDLEFTVDDDETGTTVPAESATTTGSDGT